MRKTLKNISVLAFAILFTAIVTGISFTIHQCNLYGVTGYFLYLQPGEEPCEHHHKDEYSAECCSPAQPITPGAHDSSCCNTPDNEPSDFTGIAGLFDCCSNEVFYISVEDDYIRTDIQPITVACTDMAYMAIPTVLSPLSRNNSVDTFSQTESPPLLFGKDLLFLNHSLLL